MFNRRVSGKQRLLILGLASLLFICSSCRKERDTPYWDADYLLPLLKGEMDIGNIIPDSLMTSNPDNSLNLSYNSTFYSLTMDTLFRIPDTTMYYSYLVPLGYLIVNPGDVFINSTDEEQYQINNVELVKVTVRSGYIEAKVENTVHKRMKITFTMPYAVKNSQPFSRTVTVPRASGNTPGIFVDTFRLDGYTIDLRGSSMNSFNTFIYQTTGIIDPAETGLDTVYAGEGAELEVSFKSLIPEYAKGYLSQTLVNVGPDSTAFDLFKKITAGVLRLEDATATLSLVNQIGVDAVVSLSELTSVNTRTNTSVSLNHSILNTPVNLNRAVDYGNGNVAPQTWSVTLNTLNSNFKDMIENLPDRFRYALNANVNPLGNVSGNNDFIYYGRGLNANLNLNIPLSLAAGNLTMTDTMAFAAIDPEKNGVNYGTLTLYVENGFPFDCAITITMLDANGNALGELMPTVNTIDAAPLGTNAIVSQPRITRLIIPVPESKINALENTRHLRLKLVFNTSSYPDYIKLYSFYKMGFQMVGEFNYTFNK
ncbi:MAG: hypothetical protein IT233_09635 [Bacteroidia bacterium]|nr:hypothetical protein [Bacteroidia bacterium]